MDHEEGVSMTEIKKVKGIITDGKTMCPAMVIARFTSDHLGETLSLSDNDKIMIVVAYEDIEKMAAYYQAFSLLHEVEHGYQFLIARDRIPFKYREVKDSYKGIIESIYPKKRLIPCSIKELKCHISFLKYQKNAYDFVLERNAEVEAAFDTNILAKESDDEKVAEIFESLGLAFLNIGYEENNNGCVYQTFEGILRKKEYDKIIKDPTMNEETRLRFGLNIKEETRKELIKKREKNRIKI